jgi:hypothetical protein
MLRKLCVVSPRATRESPRCRIRSRRDDHSVSHTTAAAPVTWSAWRHRSLCHVMPMLLPFTRRTSCKPQQYGEIGAHMRSCERSCAHVKAASVLHELLRSDRTGEPFTKPVLGLCLFGRRLTGLLYIMTRQFVWFNRRAKSLVSVHGGPWSSRLLSVSHLMMIF